MVSQPQQTILDTAQLGVSGHMDHALPVYGCGGCTSCLAAGQRNCDGTLVFADRAERPLDACVLRIKADSFGLDRPYGALAVGRRDALGLVAGRYDRRNPVCALSRLGDDCWRAERQRLASESRTSH